MQDDDVDDETEGCKSEGAKIKMCAATRRRKKREEVKREEKEGLKQPNTGKIPSRWRRH